MPTLDTDDGDTETYSDEEERLGFKLDLLESIVAQKKKMIVDTSVVSMRSQFENPDITLLRSNVYCLIILLKFEHICIFYVHDFFVLKMFL